MAEGEGGRLGDWEERNDDALLGCVRVMSLKERVFAGAWLGLGESDFNLTTACRLLTCMEHSCAERGRKWRGEGKALVNIMDSSCACNSRMGTPQAFSMRCGDTTSSQHAVRVYHVFSA